MLYMFMCSAANNYLHPASQNDLENSKYSAHTKILPGHNVLKFLLLLLLLLLYCITQMDVKQEQ